MTRTHGGTTTTFHFSGNRITTEKQGANITAHYVYGVNRVSRDASGNYEYYHNDGIGSTRQISNDTQTITQTTTYDAFGNIESSSGSSSNVYKYAGQWGYRNDGDDGLMHVGARYYDPLVGRFLQADTWLGEIARPQSLNRYTYTENDPVNSVDPRGHKKRRVKVVLTGSVKHTPGKPDEYTGSIALDITELLFGPPDDKPPPQPPQPPPTTIILPDGTKIIPAPGSTIRIEPGGGITIQPPGPPGGGPPRGGNDDECP